MPVITLSEKDIKDLRDGNSIKMIVTSEKYEDTRIRIIALSDHKKED